jgi:hypothetical protein
MTYDGLKYALEFLYFTDEAISKIYWDVRVLPPLTISFMYSTIIRPLRKQYRDFSPERHLPCRISTVASRSTPIRFP